MKAIILEASHTHLYPGLCGEISGLVQIEDLQTGCDCMVAFSDGSVASARLSGAEGGWQLHTNSYRTAAGTDISEKHWLVCLYEDGNRVAFRVLKKVRV